METLPEESNKIPTPTNNVIFSGIKNPAFLFTIVLVLLLGIGVFVFFHNDVSAGCPEAAGQSLPAEKATIASEVPVMRTISSELASSSNQQLMSVQGLSFDIPSQVQATIGSSSVYTKVTFGDKEITILPFADIDGMTDLDSNFATSKCLEPKFILWKGNASDYEEERNVLYLTPDSGKNLPHDLLLMLLAYKEIIAEDTSVYEASTPDWYFFQMHDSTSSITLVDVFDKSGKQTDRLLFKNMSQDEIDVVLSSLKSN